MMTSKVTRLGHCIKTFNGLLIFYAALVLYPASVRANSFDHSMVVDTATGCAIVYSCASITGLRFPISSTAGPHDVFDSTNTSGVNLGSLILTEVGEPAIDITCTSNLFGCQMVPYGNDGARIVVRAFGNLPGVAAGKIFELGYGCKGDCLSWPSDTTSTEVSKRTIPEPATAPMLLLGFAALFRAKAYGAGRRLMGKTPRWEFR
jgi:hypothetical protein